MLAIWSLVPLPFLNPTWTSGISWFTYCWSLACRILSIAPLWALTFTVIWMQLFSILNILWHCLSVCSNSCPLSWWCYLTISSSVCSPLLPLPSIFPSTRGFSNKSIICIRWQKYWSFRFSNSPPNEYPGLISFMIYWYLPQIQHLFYWNSLFTFPLQGELLPIRLYLCILSSLIAYKTEHRLNKWTIYKDYFE